MNNFNDFGIAIEQTMFVGNKIKIRTIINKSIVVHAYKIEQSKFEGKGDCLHLQIEVDKEKRVVFTGAKGLIEQIQKVPKDGMPFSATITEQDERLMFN